MNRSLRVAGTSPDPDRLDMAHPRDRAMVRRLMDRQRRWAGLNEDFKAECTEGLKAALPAARGAGDYGAVNDIVRTAAILEGQNQKDEHKEAEIKASTTNTILGRLPPEHVSEIAKQIAQLSEPLHSFHVESSLESSQNDRDASSTQP